MGWKKRLIYVKKNKLISVCGVKDVEYDDKGIPSQEKVKITLLKQGYVLLYAPHIGHILTLIYCTAAHSVHTIQIQHILRAVSTQEKLRMITTMCLLSMFTNSPATSMIWQRESWTGTQTCGGHINSISLLLLCTNGRY